jgi:hypothetical protein
MKVKMVVEMEGMKVDQVFEGATADEVVGKMKAAYGAVAPLAIRTFLNVMSPLAFAQEATRRYNAAKKTSEPVPKSCAEFVEGGQRMGIIEVVEP